MFKEIMILNDHDILKMKMIMMAVVLMSVATDNDS